MPPIHNELVFLFFSRGILSRHQEPRAVRFVSESFELAFVSELCIPHLIGDGRAVRSFAKPVDLAVAFQHVDVVASNRDCLEVTTKIVTHKKLLESNAGFRIQDENPSDVVVVREKLAAWSQRETGNLLEL